MQSEANDTANVDAAEIEKFAALASRWWDTKSEFKTLHDINPLRIDYISQQCRGLNGKKVLEIELHSDDWRKHVADSKFRDIDQFAAKSKGHIALQDHGYRVWYRGIRIRRLPAKQEPRHEGN